MLFLDTFLYYTFFASAILIYGIGINRIAEVGIIKYPSFIFVIKIVISIIASSVLSWLVTSRLLVPLNLVELYPIIVFLILLVINTFVEGIVRLTSNTVTTEFVVSYLVTLISIGESTSLLQSIVICFSVLCSFVILIPFIISFRFRLTRNGKSISEKYYSIFFIFIGVIILMISIFDISWLNFGVFE